MKKTFVLYYILSILICCTACMKKEIEIDYKRSWFSNYEIHENKVVFYCVVSIINPSSRERKFCINGDFNKDQKSGLLVERTLMACELGNDNSVFRISSKSSLMIEVRFTGTFAGNPIRADKLLPSISLIIVD